MRRFIRHIAWLAAAGLAGAVLVVWLGLYNVSARQGHWPGVEWLLHTTYEHAVELRAPPASATPDLGSADLVALGARHYDSACRLCHGAPGERQPATIRAMEPVPPPITEAVADWEPEELFWIVKNGVKMTGMPAWPTRTRDDDVWAVVAFLRQVDAAGAGYAELVAAPPVSEMPDLARCTACHGSDGGGRGNQFVPRLDILGETYMAASLEAYRGGARQSGIMHQATSTLDDAAIARLARHFAGAGSDRPGHPATAAADPLLVETGRRLAMGDPADPDVAACRACHGPWPTRRSPLFPTIAGQYEPYLRTQLHLWRDGERGGTSRAHLMHAVAAELIDDEIDALAAFYASLPPTPADTRGQAAD